MKLPLRLIIDEQTADIAEVTLVDADDVPVEASMQDLQEAVNAYNNYPKACELLKRVADADMTRIVELVSELEEFLRNA